VLTFISDETGGTWGTQHVLANVPGHAATR
jgi:hypothetical protein